MLSLVYVSAARLLFSDADLAELLLRSLANNRRDGITGMLLYMDGNFMQALEGEPDKVGALYQKILRDPRHTRITTVLELAIETRRFAGWAMALPSFDNLPLDDRAGCSAFLTRPGEMLGDGDGHPVLHLLDSFRQTMR
ncbi:MAG TPA: BLUF domain-containing protein [Stellaceae bacterium]|nr:BLUF domain-containing protein [Stellaceae bacterium]